MAAASIGDMPQPQTTQQQKSRFLWSGYARSKPHHVKLLDCGIAEGKVCRKDRAEYIVTLTAQTNSQCGLMQQQI